MPKMHRKRNISTSESSDSEVNNRGSTSARPSAKNRRVDQKYECLLSKLKDIEQEIRNNKEFSDSNESAHEIVECEIGREESVENVEGGVDKRLLELLGKNPNEDEKIGENIHEEIAVRWENYVSKRVDKNIIIELVKKYPIPGNGRFLEPPKLNDEVGICLNREAKKQDCHITQLQNQLTAVLSAIGLLASDIIKNPGIVDSQRILTTLADSGQVLCDNLHQLSNHRRFLIKPFLKEDKMKVLDKCPIDEYLFGKKLQESIQAEKTVTKAAKEIKLDAFFRNMRSQRSSSFVFESQPGPSGIQRENHNTKPYFNYRRPQNNSRKRTAPRNYNRPRQQQRRTTYSSRKYT